MEVFIPEAQGLILVLPIISLHTYMVSGLIVRHPQHFLLKNLQSHLHLQKILKYLLLPHLQLYLQEYPLHLQKFLHHLQEYLLHLQEYPLHPQVYPLLLHLRHQ